MVRKKRDASYVGGIRIRLAELLTAQGFEIYGEDLLPAQGVYRSSPYHDVHRWEGFGKTKNHPTMPDGHDVFFSSWDTMTLCVRHGIDIDHSDRDSYGHFGVHAKGQ